MSQWQLWLSTPTIWALCVKFQIYCFLGKERGKKNRGKREGERKGGGKREGERKKGRKEERHREGGREAEPVFLCSALSLEGTQACLQALAHFTHLCYVPRCHKLSNFVTSVFTTFMVFGFKKPLSKMSLFTALQLRFNPFAEVAKSISRFWAD